MFCRKCGKNIADNARFCSECGTAQFSDKRLDSEAYMEKKQKLSRSIKICFIVLLIGILLKQILLIWLSAILLIVALSKFFIPNTKNK